MRPTGTSTTLNTAIVEKFISIIRNADATGPEAATFLKERVADETLGKAEAQEIAEVLGQQGLNVVIDWDRIEEVGAAALRYEYNSYGGRDPSAQVGKGGKVDKLAVFLATQPADRRPSKRVLDHPSVRGLRRATAKLDTRAQQMPDDSLEALQNLCRANQPERIVEIGTYTGGSILTMALAAPNMAKLHTCDIEEDKVAVGKPYWEEAGVASRIDSRIEPGLHFLESLQSKLGAESVDLAVIDGDFGNYQEYFDRMMEMLKPGGILVIDDVNWWGLHDPLARRAFGENPGGLTTFRRLIDHVHSNRDDRIASHRTLNVGNGLLVIRKASR